MTVQMKIMTFVKIGSAPQVKLKRQVSKDYIQISSKYTRMRRDRLLIVKCYINKRSEALKIMEVCSSFQIVTKMNLRVSHICASH